VLGAGAIGCLFAAHLHRGGAPVSLVLRDAPAEPAVTLAVEADDGDESLWLAASGAASPDPIGHLLVTTKAYDVHAAVDALAHRLVDGATVLLLVNGMGLAAPLRERYPGIALFCGTTTEGAYALGPRHIRYAGRGETRIGGRGGEMPPSWFARWSRCVPRCRWDDAIDEALWDKLAVNCVINPLTALHRCRNGELGERRALRDAVAALCGEVAQVSYAAGFTHTAQTIGETAQRVITATAGNRSSMLQDVDAGRPTEIDYITGYLLRVAAEHGIPARHNAELYEEIKTLER
jgi:2-dehydropantoate 2-reductase